MTGVQTCALPICEIGKYSGGGGGNVNVYLDGRLIQREMAKTSDNKRFNTNGG